MALDQAALAKWGESMRANKQAPGKHEVNWIVDGYNQGFLTADEAKTRFNRFIDDLEGQRDGQA